MKYQIRELLKSNDIIPVSTYLIDALNVNSEYNFFCMSKK